jgi:hypothetical protein
MQKYLVTTTSQVERDYTVEVDAGLSGEEQAKQAQERLRVYLKDPAMIREGVVEKTGERNTSAEQRKGEPKKLTQPKAVEGATDSSRKAS